MQILFIKQTLTMAVKRRLPAGSHSTTSSSGEATPTSATTALEDNKASDNLDVWNTENELKLFKALISHKPAGISKHFQMALIINKLTQGK